MMEHLVPRPAAVVESWTDDPEEEPFAGEEAAVASAVGTRRREFVTARRCAREALAQLGVAPVAIGVGQHREPLWPSGCVGAITHCIGYRAAAVGRAKDVAGIGIDAEPHQPLPANVLEAVAAEGEADQARAIFGTSSVHWDRLLFSAKESVYKAWFPLTGQWLGFEDAWLSFDPSTESFHACLLVGTGTAGGGFTPTQMVGRYLIAGSLILTAVVVPRTAGG